MYVALAILPIYAALGRTGEHILKKLSEKQRHRHVRLIALRQRRRSARPDSPETLGRTREAKERFSSNRAKLPKVKMEYGRREEYACFIPPKEFSLSSNYDKTLAFIYDFKSFFSLRRPIHCPDGTLRRVYAEFSDIEAIGPGAGLVLAAEIHQFAESRLGRIEVHDQFWTAQVRDYFVDTGLFELLGINPHEVGTKGGTSATRQTLKYQSGSTSRGSDVGQLLHRLQGLAGQAVGSRVKVYNAIAEALANVHHAYPSWFYAWPYRTSRRWWTSGFWEADSKTVGLQLYDQGAGIPATLPRQTQWPRILEIFDPEHSDSGRIAAAMEYGRTSTGTQGRGKGLAEMAEWIETSGSGFLRILSGRGEVTYRPGQKITRRNHHASFDGTLVQWELSLA